MKEEKTEWWAFDSMVESLALTEGAKRMSDLVLPSDIFKGSNLRKDLPEAFLQASAIWTEVKKKILKYSEQGGTFDSEEILFDIKVFEAMFTKSCWGWLPSCQIVRFNKMDRLGQHFFGPMYTCEGFEWPEYKGCPFRPWVQLDLDKASETAGVDLNGGLLQFFETPEYDCHEQYFVRHIPRDFISIKAMTPLPHFTPSKAETFEKYFDCNPDALFGEKAKCIKVKAFDRKVFSMLDTDLFFDNHDEIVIVREDIDDMLALLGSLKGEEKKAEYRMCLFGCDRPIQSCAWVSSDVLLNLGHCDRQSTLLDSHLNNNFDSDVDFFGHIYFDGSGAIYFDRSQSEGSFFFMGSR